MLLSADIFLGRLELLFSVARQPQIVMSVQVEKHVLCFQLLALPVSCYLSRRRDHIFQEVISYLQQHLDTV